MAHLNNINQLPFIGDIIKDVKFHQGIRMVDIYFENGNKVTLHINDDGEYRRSHYEEDKKLNLEN